MQFESIPLFKTRQAVAGVDAGCAGGSMASTPTGWRIIHCTDDALRTHLERKNADARPPLPDDMAVTGLPTLTAALEAAAGLAQHRTRAGRGAAGYYVRG